MDEDLFARLEQPISQLLPSSWPKIQRVALHLRNRQGFEKYYSPKMVSLGPIHHGEPHLELGEQFKITWASMYVQGDRNKAQRLHRVIVADIEDLKALYTHDAIRHFDDQQLARMLFLDGCALLQILQHPAILDPEPPHAKVNQLALVRQDALLLENQLPFRVLKLLNDKPYNTEFLMDRFLGFGHFAPKSHSRLEIVGFCISNDDDPAHLLDKMRRLVLIKFPLANKERMFTKGKTTYRNLKELKAAGIQVKRSKSECPIHITFSSYSFGGELKLPDIIVGEDIARTLLNLTAYEMCPDFHNRYEISSYVEFLDCLIDHPDDVKELRRAQILPNNLGSDEEIANLFNIIGTDVVPNAAIYHSLKHDIETHYRRKRMTWFALAFDTYFSNPWSVIAFIAASLLLLLTFVQTWFAAFPSHH